MVIVVQKHVASKVCPTRCARTRTYCNAHALFIQCRRASALSCVATGTVRWPCPQLTHRSCD